MGGVTAALLALIHTSTACKMDDVARAVFVLTSQITALRFISKREKQNVFLIEKGEWNNT